MPELSAPILRLLARLSGAVALGNDSLTREAMRYVTAHAGELARVAVEEALLQTYLFAGFPAAINGFVVLEEVWPAEKSARETNRPPTRRHHAREGYDHWRDWRSRGEALCAEVYGPSYARLRTRMRELSPELDEWMVMEGYGKTLSRPGLSTAARELCAVAALAALGADRQLRPHLESVRRAGVGKDLVEDVLAQAKRDRALAGTMAAA